MKKLTSLSLALFAALLLAACNTDQQSSSSASESSDSAETVETTETTKEVAEISARLTVAHSEGIWLLDTEDFEIHSAFETPVSALAFAPDTRHVFVNHRENGKVRLLDTGVWSEPHGDHSDSFVEQPALSDFEISGDEPTHFVNHGGQTAIYYDGDGKVEIYAGNELSSEQPVTAKTTLQTPAHHGVAVPLSDGSILASYTPEDNPQPLPEGIALFTADGTEELRFTTCPGLHGEASGGIGDYETIGFGCEGSVLLYHPAEKSTTELALPDTDARVGSLKGNHASDYLLGNYSSKTNAAVNTKISLVNLQDRSLSTIELGTEYTSSMIVDKELGYVLGKDGTVYVVDLVEQAVISTIAAIDPIAPAEGHGHGAPSPAMALVESTLFITDPVAKTLTQVDILSKSAAVVQTFDTAPVALLAQPKAEPHAH